MVFRASQCCHLGAGDFLKERPFPMGLGETCKLCPGLDPMYLLAWVGVTDITWVLLGPFRYLGVKLLGGGLKCYLYAYHSVLSCVAIEAIRIK